MTPDRDDLERAYRATTYFVDGPNGRFGIRTGLPCPALDELLRRHGATSWAYLTAHNPGSRPHAEEANRRWQQELEGAVGQAGFAFYPGEGVGDAGDWPAERSVLVIGIEERTALELARRFGQAALVVGTAGQPARLVWV